MAIDPHEYNWNEAWLLFRLNDAPVCTESDGDFNVMAIMDVGTGLILGMEFVGVLQEELSEFESSRLLKNPHAARSCVKNRLKMLMYCAYTALSRRFLP